jgi:hypothetical protein
MEYDLKRFGQDYLLSELASNAFLPGYGFPTGVATFDNYSVYDFKKNKYKKGSDKGRIDNITRMKERPGRDISVAIREYAPGADVVLDGLVYKSAGILLNLYNPGESSNQSVKIDCEWRCHHCGCIGQSTSSIFDRKCSECGTDLKQANIKEFIEPQGFAVDFYSSPTTDISIQQYIPVEEPWVTANESLRPLFNPLLGSYRNSTEGHIFHHSSGVNGNGYAICLRCGKADSMTIDGDFPKDLQPGKEHRKLQGKPGAEESAVCEGSDDQYAISPNLHLGASDQTDVFELYLKNPATANYLPHRPNDTLSWTVAVVLRQALADIHGINADEIGYSVKPTSLPGCESASGIALYDRCGGGAGFSSAAPIYIQDMLKKAQSYLECPDECGSACQSCLLGYDTRFHVSLLNRFVAKEFLESISNFVSLPDEQKLYGDETQYCIGSIDSEILRHSDQGYDSISINLQSPCDEWDLIASGVKSRVIEWQKRFKSISIILPNDFGETENSILMGDLTLLKSLGAKIEKAKKKYSGLALLEKEGQSISFATSNSSVGIPSEKFWNLQESCLVSGVNQPKPETEDYKLAQPVETIIQQSDVEVEIWNECDVPVSRFGLKLWEVLASHSEKLNELLTNGSEIKRLSYSDGYVCSPWSLMLFAEVIDGLKQKLKLAWNNPIIELTTSDKESNTRLNGLIGEWRAQHVQEQVFEKVFEHMGEQLKLEFKPIKAMPHGRALVIEWESGVVTTVRFDHGMGYWKVQSRSRPWFDTESEVDKQVKDLFSAMTLVSTRQGREFPTQVFIKHR